MSEDQKSHDNELSEEELERIKNLSEDEVIAEILDFVNS